MIIGTFITNTEQNQIVSRFTDPLFIDKIDFIISGFTLLQKEDEGVWSGHLYKYIYKYSNTSFYVLVTSLLYSDLQGKRIINYLINNTTEDLLDQLITIDNILYGSTAVFPNLSLIKKLESQEEKIYKIMMKNKEKEIQKKQMDLYKSVNKDTDKSGTPFNPATTSFSPANTSSNPVLQKNVKESCDVKNRVKRFEISESSVFICLKERLKCEVDVDNKIKNCEISGEMSLNIKDEAYKRIQIQLKGDTKKYKFSPKLDKEASTKGLIKTNKDFSINKNIALMKWKENTIKSLPISFTFWPSEIKANVYQISLEYSAEENMQDLLICIPKKGMSNVVVEGGTQTSEHIEWKIGYAETGDSDTLEFQCRCKDITEIFPIQVFFISDKICADLQIENVVADSSSVDEFEVKRVLETDEFGLVYE